ncbi:MAG: hypothetical protein O6761_02225 [Thaumarchaeota archaeon]|nr:hypothetical protein [Nitrososphaerota archaeon]
MQAAEDTPQVGEMAEQSKQTMKRLESLISESLQLYELDNQKSNTTDELVNSLRVITEYLGFSVNVLPGIFDLPADSNVLILPSLDIIVRKSNGKTEKRRLDQLEPEKITPLLEYIVPLFLNLIQKEKTSMIEKITFLREATTKLKQMQNIKTGGSPASSDTVEGGQTQNV